MRPKAGVEGGGRTAEPSVQGVCLGYLWGEPESRAEELAMSLFAELSALSPRRYLLCSQVSLASTQTQPHFIRGAVSCLHSLGPLSHSCKGNCLLQPSPQSTEFQEKQ